MRKHVTLITGAGGEIGHGLIERLAADGDSRDHHHRPQTARALGLASSSSSRSIMGSILETHLLERILSEYEVDTIYHLAAILSTRAEFTPVTGHQVNVEGTLKLLDFAQAQGESHGRAVVFLYPSSIAAYGLPDLETKARVAAVREHEWNNPTTMYGCNKLYCEHLGATSPTTTSSWPPRSSPARSTSAPFGFPGLISAVTVPSGGTSDFAPEMIHAAARGESYACFVRPDTRIPFMVMPDAVDALVQLAQADAGGLSQNVYNITAFNPSAAEIRDLVVAGFPDAEITFEPDLKRQAIVDSWPADVDDSAARADWGLAPRYDLERGFSEFLIPRIRERYGAADR